MEKLQEDITTSQKNLDDITCPIHSFESLGAVDRTWH
jgi:hypothetical protein